ncbi:helix-turn-helix domain-containing protein [Thiomicrospira sp.]|uniref:helix-turn-helix domain-containing protein n=1 Tax=Thiomicrospira sp. TaxID=935 RepID=UPI0025E3DE13|nr:helix-turn-helix domain-containing protein [Thiomicrospira sp.]
MNERLKTLTLQQVAELLQVNPETVRRHAQAGKIPCAKLGSKWVFIEQDVAQYLRNQYSKKVGVARVVDNNEESLCQYTSAETSGGLNLLHQTEDEYAAQLKLGKNEKRKNTKQR